MASIPVSNKWLFVDDIRLAPPSQRLRDKIMDDAEDNLLFPNGISLSYEVHHGVSPELSVWCDANFSHPYEIVLNGSAWEIVGHADDIALAILNGTGGC